MAYDLQEQEQIAALKAWWNKYGNAALTVLTVVMLAFAAFNGWKWYQRSQAAQAAVLYDAVARAVEQKDDAKVKTSGGLVVEQYRGTVYAAMAALHVARASHAGGDLATAKAQLRWVIEKSGHEEFVPIARVRLAGVLLDEKAYDDALAAIGGAIPAGHATAYADRRGDILLAQGKVEEARAAYRQALDAAERDHPLRTLIELKLDALPAAA